MAIGKGGDLRQVRDAQDLMDPREIAELLANDGAHAAADVGVDFVEHQDAHAIRLRQMLLSASMTRESSPPEAMRRRGRAGWPGLGAIINSAVSRPEAVEKSERDKALRD